MPNVTLVFFLLLIPLSGFIAWAGDRIGHKSGKRRHSLFGLRPRHTAMVFTIGAGILTTLVSFGAFYLFSTDFRNVVEHGQEMIEKAHELEEQNRLKTAELEQSRKQVQSVRGELDTIESERQKFENARDFALKNLEAVRAKRAQAEALAATAKENYNKAQKGWIQAQDKLTQAQGNLERVRRDLSSKTAKADEANTRRIQAEANYKKAQDEASKARGLVLTARNNLQNARDDVKNTINMNKTLYKQTKDLISQAEGLQNQLEENKKQFDDLTKRTDELRGQVAVLQGEKARTQREIVTLRQNASALRGGQITYQVGEEVDRLTIPAGRNIWRIKAILYSFLSSASKKAEARGAGRNATDRSVVILPQAYSDSATTVSDQGRSNRDVKVYTEENAISDAAELIRRANEDTVIVANAATNAVAGETVPINFHVLTNRVVIKADTKLGEISINGDGPRQEIADRLLLFLNQDIHRELLKSGIIPHLRSEDVTGGDTTRVAEQFSLGGEEWLSLIDRVRNAGPKAKIVVYPAHDLRAADTPELRFDVRHPLLQAPAFLRDVK